MHKNFKLNEIWKLKLNIKKKKNVTQINSNGKSFNPISVLLF